MGIELSENIQVLSSRGKSLSLKISSVILEIELQEDLPDLQIIQIGPCIQYLYEDWCEKNWTFFLFNRETYPISLPANSQIEIQFLDRTSKKFGIESVVVKKAVPFRLAPTERCKVIGHLDNFIHECGYIKESLFDLPNSSTYYYEGLRRSFQENDWAKFNLLLDELIGSRYKAWQRADQAINKQDKGHKISSFLLSKVFWGDLYCFYIKIPMLFVPEACEFKSHYRHTFQFFDRFFKRQAHENQSIYWNSVALSSLLLEKLGSVCHDFNILRSHDPREAPTSYMRSACTLISDIYEIVKKVVQEIERVFPRSKLSNYPKYNRIINAHLDKDLRNSRFHEKIEWTEGAARIPIEKGRLMEWRTYKLEEIEKKAYQGSVLFFIIHECYWVNYLGAITIRIPEEPITESFQIILKLVSENPSIFLKIINYLILFFSSFINAPLTRENLRSLFDQGDNL